MQLLLYTTDYCQLCEEAEELIYRVLSGYQYEIEKVDVSESGELINDYGLRIPVLGIVEHKLQELDWPFDADQLKDFLKQVGLDDGAI